MEYDREFYEDYDIDWTYAIWHPTKVGIVRMSDEQEEKPNTNLKEGQVVI